MKIQVSSRLAHHVPVPRMIRAYYDIDGVCTIYDEWNGVPENVAKDMKNRWKYMVGYATCMGLGILVLFLVLAS